MIVTDAGVLVVVFVDDGIWETLREPVCKVKSWPLLSKVDLEVISALRGLRRVGKVDERRAGEALADLRDLSFRRASHRELVTRCWGLRDNLSAYAASYVAELLGVTLVTTDARLSRAPQIMCEVEVLSRTDQLS